MTKRRGLNLGALKLISEDEVPEIRRRTPYRELLERIPKGNALVLTNDDVNLLTAGSAIRDLQKKGEFTEYVVTRRTIDGEKKLFVINPSEKRKNE